MKKRIGLLVLFFVLTAAAGCQNRAETQDELVNVVKTALTANTQKNFPLAESLMTGDALAGLRAVVPGLQAAQYTSEMQSFKAVVHDFSDKEGTVEATYTVVQTVQGSGTETHDVDAYYHLVRLPGQGWKIDNIALIAIGERSGK